MQFQTNNIFTAIFKSKPGISLQGGVFFVWNNMYIIYTMLLRPSEGLMVRNTNKRMKEKEMLNKVILELQAESLLTLELEWEWNLKEVR